MTSALEPLAVRIRDERTDLDQAVSRIGRAWAKVLAGEPDRDLYLDSVALHLHAFYSGLERLFELVARLVDRDLPSGPSWHDELLRAMTENQEGIRPAVVSTASAERLDEDRRFRHLVRNVYAINLLPDRVSSLVEGLPGVWELIREERSPCADFLEAASEPIARG